MRLPDALPRLRRREPPARPAPPVVPPGAVRRLHLDVARRLDGVLHGDHLGHLPGPGTEPDEARLYVPGDDVRRIDWSVTARAGDVHVRTPVSERELETTIVVDLTPSMAFGTARCEKRDVAVAVTAALAHLVRGPGDRVGAVVLSDRVRAVPPRQGRDAGLALLQVLQTTRPDDAADAVRLADGLASVAAQSRRRGLVAVVSDLLDGDPPGAEPAWVTPLRRLGTRHDVVVVEVIDPRELELPSVGVLHLTDPETGRRLEVQTGDRRLRERYARAAAEQRAAHAAAVRKAGATHVVVRTDRDWLPDLARALAVRRRLRAAGRPAAAGRGRT
ncbi:MAG TPA: DUF58 domain-containing protein [Mycobacteriales bacterium]|nr:DUF58 domain-containing protein [Mycobacteriales bacterium]